MIYILAYLWYTQTHTYIFISPYIVLVALVLRANYTIYNNCIDQNQDKPHQMKHVMVSFDWTSDYFCEIEGASILRLTQIQYFFFPKFLPYTEGNF